MAFWNAAAERIISDVQSGRLAKPESCSDPLAILLSMMNLGRKHK